MQAVANTSQYRPLPLAAILLLGCAALALHPAAATADAAATTPAASASQGTAQPLFARDLLGQPGKEVTMLTVEYPPGGATSPHRHDAQVFVYVLAGSVRMQVKGAPEVTLKVGDTFYEAPNDVHSVSANASTTQPAKILVVMIKDKSHAATTAVPKE